MLSSPSRIGWLPEIAQVNVSSIGAQTTLERTVMASDHTIAVLDPSTGEEIGRVPAGNPEAVDAAVPAARPAQTFGPELLDQAPLTKAVDVKPAPEP